MRHGRATGALDTRWGVFSLIVWLGLCLPLPSHAADAVSYLNDVVPVLTKSGCNLGVCHAKAGGGQNGFQLSLLGFEPAEDHEQLTVADRGRRLALGEPERSLLLRKATGTVPHGGGVRLRQDSSGYQLLRDWISQGAHSDLAQAPRITRLEVDPAKATLAAGGSQQLTARASYSDGTVRDVTPFALFES
ncbi:MAG: Ig domain-containing protein, partial [Planctomycetaceae bacterium]